MAYTDTSVRTQLKGEELGDVTDSLDWNVQETSPNFHETSVGRYAGKF